MTWSSRPLSAEERDQLVAELGPYPGERREIISKIAYYGTFLILIPLSGGGFLARALVLGGLAEQTAYLTGIVLAGLASPALYLFLRQRERERQARWTSRRAELEAIRDLPVFHFQIERVWRIESEPDWPAYLFGHPDGSFLLLSTPLLQFVEEPFAFDGLQISVAPNDRTQVLSLRWSGLPVPLQTHLLPMPEEWWPEDGSFAVLQAAQLPEAWRSVAGTG